MISSIISRLVILVFGTLYPAYASYKAVRTKNLKEYVKWMMYWIVFALFTCTETFTDVFLSWFPFYYEVKIVIVLWLLSPATKGSSILYRKFVHPALCRREQEIDEYIAKAKDQGYHTVLNLGTKGVNYATTVIMQTAIKGGGGLVQQLRKSYSLSDLSETDARALEAHDTLPQMVRRNHNRSGYNTRRSASESSRSMYFPEVDVDVRATGTDQPDFSHIKSSEDISSGYSSADNSSVALSRAGSVGARTRAKLGRTALTAIKRPQAAEDSEVIIEELHEEDSFDYNTMPPLLNMPSPLYLSHTNPPFIYQYIGDQVRIIQVLGDPLPGEIENDKNNIAKEIKQSHIDTLVTSNAEATKVKLEIPEPVITKVQTETIAENDENNNMPKVDQNVKEVEMVVCDTHIRELPGANPTVDVVNNVVTNNEVDASADNNKTEISEVSNEKADVLESTSLETSLNENESADSDDEASFGTPDNSPKMKRKSPRGRYGKGKAPPPPTVDHPSEPNELNVDTADDINENNNNPTEPLVTVTKKSLHVVNPIAENKRRHKSKSPNRAKNNATAIGKLLQLPGKLAFWHNKNEKSSNKRSCSDDDSRRSSTIESTDNVESDSEISLTNISREAHSTKADITDVFDKSEDQLSFKDASDFESEIISQDIIEKSDELQKLIDAKIESHPEYKFISLTEDDPSTSKSTDV